MIKARIIYICILIGLISGCTSFKNYRFRTDNVKSAGKVYEYNIKIPRQYALSTEDKVRFLIKEYKYADSSSLYISLDITFANSPNMRNWRRCSSPEKGIKCKEGRQSDGRWWKEIVSYDLVIGYYNVKTSKKIMFDEALASLAQLARVENN